MWRLAGKALLALFLLVMLVYATDFVQVRVPFPASRQVYGTVQVEHFLSVGLKNGRREYDYTGTDAQTCIHALFPQRGQQPCWWLERHRQQMENY